MPAFLLIIMMLLGFLVGFILLCERFDGLFMCVYFIIVIVAPAFWLHTAWDQDWCYHEYHYVETLQYPSGKIVYMVYPEGYELGHSVPSSIPLTNDTIVKVSREDAWKNGINWLNNRKLHFSIIPPTDKAYSHLKQKAQRKTVKSVDVEIKER